MKGRPPHTDSVSHDGTFHYQLCGRKTWHVSRHGTSHVIEVGPGDALLIDTKSWTHSTVIPSQQGEGSAVSISIARDVYLDREKEKEDGMTNVDAPWATEEIPKGTCIFTASQWPDLQLGRSDDPNCELVDMGSDVGIVSTRDIPVGEFFCVAHSDDEEEEEEKSSSSSS